MAVPYGVEKYGEGKNKAFPHGCGVCDICRDYFFRAAKKTKRRSQKKAARRAGKENIRKIWQDLV